MGGMLRGGLCEGRGLNRKADGKGWFRELQIFIPLNIIRTTTEAITIQL